jgi:WD repeat-containing protein 61
MYRQAAKIERAHADAIWAVKWTSIPDVTGNAQSLILTGSVDETVRVWDAATLRPEKAEPLFVFENHDLPIVSLAASADGKTVASSSMDVCIRLFDLSERRLLKTIQAGPVETWTVDFHPHEPCLASGAQSGNVNLWDSMTGERRGVLEGHGSFCMSVAYSPMGTHLATGAHDGMLIVYDTTTGKAIHRLSAHKRAVRALAWSPDGSALLSGGEDGFIHAFEAKTGELIATLAGHTSWILGLAFNPQGVQFASSSSDRKIKIWDFKRSEKKECVHTFDSHTDQVWGIAYSPNGQQLASVSDDASLQVFDAHEK